VDPVHCTQAWDLDQIGDWDTDTSDEMLDTRTHNAQNELTADRVGALGYVNNGNLLIHAVQGVAFEMTLRAWSARPERRSSQSRRAWHGLLDRSRSPATCDVYVGHQYFEATRLHHRHGLAASARSRDYPRRA
jgi:hypothetical protein